MLLGHELSTREQHRQETNRKQAGIQVEKHLEEFDYRHQTMETVLYLQNYVAELGSFTPLLTG